MLEIAGQIAAHESLVSTGLYDRGDDDVILAELEVFGVDERHSDMAGSRRRRP
jgi:hypothetical protein